MGAAVAGSWLLLDVVVQVVIQHELSQNQEESF